jgi:ribosome-associated protein
MREEEQAPEAEEAPSKSELKRRMSALQTLGETLVTLNEQQLARIPIDDRLLEAIREARQIRSNSARRRHLQYIGKLMRDIDPAPIQRALDELHQRHQQANEDFHRLEQLRDDVLLAGLKGVELVVDAWPEADRQQLRQILLQHQRELKLGKPPAAARKLFRYLRELQDS